MLKLVKYVFLTIILIASTDSFCFPSGLTYSYDSPYAGGGTLTIFNHSAYPITVKTFRLLQMVKFLITHSRGKPRMEHCGVIIPQWILLKVAIKLTTLIPFMKNLQ